MFPAAALFVLFAAAERMVEEKRPGVELHTDVPREERDALWAEIRFALREAEALCRRLELRRDRHDRIRLRVFEHEADFEDFRRRTRDRFTNVSTLSYYNPSDREAVCVWIGGEDRARAQLRRQVGRTVLLQFAPRASNWFEEGFAGVIEGLEPDPFYDVLDDVNRGRLRELRRAIEQDLLVPLFELQDLQDPQFYGIGGAARPPAPRSVLYAESWGLLYFLLKSENEEARTMLEKIAQRAETGRWNQREFEKRLGALEEPLRAFFRSDEFEEPGRLRRRAWAALKEEDFGAAEKAARAALEREPESRSARRALGRALYGLGRYEEAAAEFERLLTDEDADTWISLARSLAAAARERQGGEAAARLWRLVDRLDREAPKEARFPVLVEAARSAADFAPIERALDIVRAALRAEGGDPKTRGELKELERRLIKRAIGRDG